MKPIYVLIIILGCIEYLFHYRLINVLLPNLTEKQKGSILAIKNAITMIIISSFFIYKFFSEKCQNKFLEPGNDKFLAEISTLYLMSYFIMDLLIGMSEYPNYLETLTGYIHHTVYIIIGFVILHFNLAPLFLLMLIEELPTLFMNLASFDKSYRNDELFGASFFITRILFHIVILYICRESSIILYLGIVVLGVHLYWFYKWFTKYGEKTLIKKH